MTVLANTTIKTLSDCVAGELIGMHGKESLCMGIVMNEDLRGGRYVGVLDPDINDDKAPTMFALRGDTPVVSHGIEWAIKPLFGNFSYPQNRRYVEKPGSLHQCGNRWLICFRQAGGYSSDIIYFNVVTKARDDDYPGHEAVPYLKWDLWDILPNTAHLPAPFLKMDVTP